MHFHASWKNCCRVFGRTRTIACLGGANKYRVRDEGDSCVEVLMMISHTGRNIDVLLLHLLHCISGVCLEIGASIREQTMP